MEGENFKDLGGKGIAHMAKEMKGEHLKDLRSEEIRKMK